MFPSSWDPTHAVKKRRRAAEDQPARAPDATGQPPPVPFQSDLQQTIMRRLNTATATAPPPPELNLDHILGRVPYKRMLENLFGSADQQADTPDVPILGRAYEESFMRQPMPGERPCVMGDQCECMQIDRNAPFVGVELRLPNDPDTPQMCALCSRAATQKCFYDMCFLGRPVKGVIQRYGGIFGQPGEYAAECMLICPRSLGMASMPVPSVSHQRNRYSVVVHGGAKQLKQHRLITVTPPSRLEGEAPAVDDEESYIPECPELDREVRQIHALARRGLVPADAAERQLNTYLLAAAWARQPQCQPLLPPRLLVLPLTDAPHHGLLPDLGQIIHRVLARDPAPCALSAVVEQCIPCFRHATRVICYDRDSQEPLLSLVLALALGLYPGTVKRPGFCTRVRLYEEVHRLLTAPADVQAEFCSAHEDVLILACMEYVARVVPVHMPVQSQLLTGEDSATAGFFRRIPVLCDELRQWLDTGGGAGDGFWPSVRAACAVRVERVSRLKRCHPQHAATHERDARALVPAGQGEPSTSSMIRAHWDAPLLADGTPDEYRLMGGGLGMRGGALQHIQRELCIRQLPPNLRDMQTRSIERAARSSGDAAYLQTFRYVCMHCLLSPKSEPVAELRLDTLSLELTCATCMHKDLVRVGMVGRAMRFRRQHFFLCPSCVSVQEYKGDPTEQIWGTDEPCAHRPPPRQAASGRRRQPCAICSEPASGHTIERVDHLAGEMRLFHYCQRHAPRYDTVAKCVNARQLEGC